jgi:hypothetical protein
MMTYNNIKLICKYTDDEDFTVDKSYFGKLYSNGWIHLTTNIDFIKMFHVYNVYYKTHFYTDLELRNIKLGNILI